jgi:hypothetical protein
MTFSRSFRRLGPILTAACALFVFAASRPVYAQQADQQVYSGQGVVDVQCSAGANRTITVAPTVDTVKLRLLNCSCEESKEQVKQRAIQYMKEVASGGPVPDASGDLKTLTISGDEPVTKTYYCYSNTVTLHKAR